MLQRAAGSTQGERVNGLRLELEAIAGTATREQPCATHTCNQQDQRKHPGTQLAANAAEAERRKQKQRQSRNTGRGARQDGQVAQSEKLNACPNFITVFLQDLVRTRLNR